MFIETLKEIVNSVDGATVCAVMGFDGIKVESHQERATAMDGDLNNAWVEFGNALQQVQSGITSLSTGAVTEAMVGTHNTITIIRILSDEYFIALGMTATGNFGKGRYILRIKSPLIAQAL